jgi:hypothetical protein
MKDSALHEDAMGGGKVMGYKPLVAKLTVMRQARSH